MGMLERRGTVRTKGNLRPQEENHGTDHP
jgi:hypothetical protein